MRTKGTEYKIALMGPCDEADRGKHWMGTNVSSIRCNEAQFFDMQ